MSDRVRLGDWTCPSGNNVIAYFRPISDSLAVIDMEWDDPPPLSRADDRYYIESIRPALTTRLREYTEMIGRTVVVQL